MRKFDLIASLGANCSVAYELRRRFLRSFSLPFDWLCIDSPRTVAYLADAFRNGFSDFMLKENLVELKKGDPLFVPLTDCVHTQYYDKRSGYRFLHHFDGVIERNSMYYDKAYAVMKRRINRMYHYFSKGYIYLLIATGIQIPDAHLQLLSQSLSEVFPNTHFRLRLMQFESPTEVEVEKKVHNVVVERFGYKRKMNDYDFFQTNWEWHFLDSVIVPCKDKAKHSLIYKLWKHCGKKLGVKNAVTSYGI